MSTINSSSAPQTQTLSILSLPASPCDQVVAWRDIYRPSSATTPTTINITGNRHGQYGTDFGTVRLQRGGSAVVNSRACPSEANGETESGYGYLAFVIGYPEDEEKSFEGRWMEEENGGALGRVENWWALQQSTADDVMAKEEEEATLWSGKARLGNGLFMTFGC
jgi:hypothetical protein